jgi:hypothetical protein
MSDLSTPHCFPKAGGNGPVEMTASVERSCQGTALVGRAIWFSSLSPSGYGKHPDVWLLHSPNTSTSVLVSIYTLLWKIVGVENDVQWPIGVVTFLLP